jgi:predicted nucleic acid-binding protein
VSLLVDTSVWSLALRRDAASHEPEVDALLEALAGADMVFTTGLIVQELLQGFAGPKARKSIVERFEALTFTQPDWDDHIAAAELRTNCRRAGVQIGTVDAVLAQLCLRHGLMLLTTDQDFTLAAKHCKLKIWSGLSRAPRH